MSGARTRRQAALAAADETPTKTGPEPVAEQKVLSNGNGEAHIPIAASAEPKENIFLFAPNLIGARFPLPPLLVYAPRTRSFISPPERRELMGRA